MTDDWDRKAQEVVGNFTMNGASILLLQQGQRLAEHLAAALRTAYAEGAAAERKRAENVVTAAETMRDDATTNGGERQSCAGCGSEINLVIRPTRHIPECAVLRFDAALRKYLEAR